MIKDWRLVIGVFRQRRISLWLCLMLVSWLLVISLIGCGSGGGETPATTTTSTTSTSSTTNPSGSTTTTSTSTSSTTTTSVINGNQATASMKGGNIITSGQRTAASGLLKAFATNDMAGVVYDGVSRLPIQGVEVWAGTTLVATTDANGAFTLTGVTTDAIALTTLSPLVNDSNISSLRNTYLSASIISQASTADFYLIPYNYSGRTVSTGSLQVYFKDANGNVLSIDSDKLQSYNMGFCNVVGPDGVIKNPSSLSGSVSSVNITDVPVGENLALFVVAVGQGAGYKTVTVEAGSNSTNITIYQLTDAAGIATFEGGVNNIPGGHTVSSNAAQIDIRASNYSGAHVAVSSEGTSTTYKVMTPVFPGSDYIFNVGIVANSGGMTSNASATYSLNSLSAETVTRDFSLLDPPTNVVAGTAESNGHLIANVSWEAPASWTPSYYIVEIKGGRPDDSTIVHPIYYAYVTIPGDRNSVQIPVSPGNVAFIKGSLKAFNSMAAVNLNSTNLLTIYASKEAAVSF